MMTLIAMLLLLPGVAFADCSAYLTVAKIDLNTVVACRDSGIVSYGKRKIFYDTKDEKNIVVWVEERKVK